MNEITISPKITLPRNFATMTQVILGRKGSGKTNTAVVEAEEMLLLGQQVVVSDPTGAWWGLKSSRNGKAAGFPVYVFGGEHADVPLEEHAGEHIADAIVQGGFSAVLDTSLLRKASSQRFMAAFLERLFLKNRDALHLMIDEADLVAPQKTFSVEDGRCLGAMQDIVRRGRIRGIGCTMITQRPQVLNKDVLTQADVLCVLQLSHPKDIGAVREWIDVHADPAASREMMSSLPALGRGIAWVWAPGLGIFARDQVRQRTTFDSSATPVVGEKTVRPQVLADVDLTKLTETIKATVQAAEDNSPKKLKARIAELEKQLATPHVDTGELQQAIKDRHDALHEAFVLTNDLENLRARISVALEGKGESSPRPHMRVPSMVPNKTVPTFTEARAKPLPVPVKRNQGGAQMTLSKAQRAILTVLAQAGPCTKTKVAAWAGYSAGGGGFNNSVSACRVAGYLVGGDRLEITHGGIDALGETDLLPTGPALLQHWCSKVGKAEREILLWLVNNGGQANKSQIAEGTGYAAAGGGFNNALSRLRTLGLIEGGSLIWLEKEFAEAVTR